MITVSNERYIYEVYKRVRNSPYEWEKTPSLTFRGRPASQWEIKTYRIQQGVNGNNDSTYIICSNLPIELQPQDKIVFMGKEWIVESTGYYYDQARFVNPSVMSDDYIASRCPKGVALQ